MSRPAVIAGVLTAAAGVAASRRRCAPASLLLALALAPGCEASGGDAPPALPGPGDAAREPFVATGTEPGWRLTIDAQTLDLAAHYGDTRITAATPEPSRDGPVTRYRVETADHALTVTVRDRYCTNAMSGKPFPRTVAITLDGEHLDGCGGDTARLLIGAPWQVQRLNGSPVPVETAPTLAFGADGRVSGTDGCNRFGGRYTITGEGLRITGVAGTRMACPDPRGSLARRFLRVLETARRFGIADDGTLRLEGREGHSLRARRP